jgi:hypothetical protein
MHLAKTVITTSFLIAAAALPALARDARPALNPNGSFVDSYGTSFSFRLCGDAKADLCGVLTNLEGNSATPANLAFVGKQVMRAKRTASNQWKGALNAGGISAVATVTMVGPDTIEIQGCRAIFCQTLAFNRARPGLSTSQAGGNQQRVLMLSAQ